LLFIHKDIANCHRSCLCWVDQQS